MKNSEYIYLDYAASTPVITDVMREILPYFDELYHNSSNSISSLHKYFNDSISQSIDSIKSLLNAEDYEVIFNSGATEGINTYLKGLYAQDGHKKNHIITCKTEHKAVLAVCDYLESIGAEITYLDVNQDGSIFLEELEFSIKENTLVVALMYVNNETGIINDITTISKICTKKGVKFFCDTTQAVGKIPVDLNKTPIDGLVISGHKMYAPKGVGALILKRNTKLTPLIHGGGQQNNLRPGTLNIPGIVGIGKGVEVLNDKLESEYSRVMLLKELFESELLKTNKVSINSKKAERSPFISNIHFLENDIEEIIFPLKDKLCFATGSACTSNIIQPSHVLTAMGLDNGQAEKCLRFSFGIMSTENEVKEAITLLKNIINQ